MCTKHTQPEHSSTFPTAQRWGQMEPCQARNHIWGMFVKQRIEIAFGFRLENGRISSVRVQHRQQWSISTVFTTAPNNCSEVNYGVGVLWDMKLLNERFNFSAPSCLLATVCDCVISTFRRSKLSFCSFKSGS